MTTFIDKQTFMYNPKQLLEMMNAYDTWSQRWTALVCSSILRMEVAIN